MRAVSYFVLFVVFSKAGGLSEMLIRTQPLYGISAVTEDSENKTCHRQLNLLRVSVEERKVWAVKAMDVSGRPGGGFVYGNNLWIGSHAQCKDISNTKPLEVNYDKIEQLQTPYDYPPYPMGFTMVYLRHNSTLQLHTQQPLEWTIQLGLCIPKSCTKDDILGLAEKYFNGNYLEVQELYNVSMEVTEVRQLVDNNLRFFMLPKTIIFSVLLVLIVSLTIAGTIYDVRRHNLEKNLLASNNSSSNGKSMTHLLAATTVESASERSKEELPQQNTLCKILRCFSFYANTKDLVNTKPSTDVIGCLHGLRFLGMLWVVAVHSVLFQADYEKNWPYIFRLSEDIFAQIFSNATFCVDSYLFLSGFLVAYLYYKSKNPHKKSDGSVNYLAKLREFRSKCINRFCRLTPLYMVVLIFTDVLYTFYRDNSSLMSSERPDIMCDRYWWRNVLYINNLYPRSEMCISWSWYLSLDIQLYTITIFLLILSTIAFKTSAAAVFLLILVNILYTGWKSYSIGFVQTLDEQFVQLDALYDLPWDRMGPYFIGVITAYVLKVKLQNKLTLTKRMRIFLWTVFPLLNIWILFGMYTRQFSVEYSAVYAGISRTLWGVGIAWVVVACCTGNAGTLEKLLSFRGFIPLSRITYCAYLLNPVVANMIYLAGESPYDMSIPELALTVCGITLITFYMAYLFYVMVESPFTLLTNMVLDKKPSKTSPRESKT